MCNDSKCNIVSACVDSNDEVVDERSSLDSGVMDACANSIVDARITCGVSCDVLKLCVAAGIERAGEKSVSCAMFENELICHNIVVPA